MVTMQGLLTVDAFQPREFLKLWAELLKGSGKNPIVNGYLEATRELAEEEKDITWFDVIVIIDNFYTVLTLTLLIDEYPKDAVKIVRNALINAMKDRLLCTLMLPVYMYASEKIPEAVEDLNYQCGDEQTF
jgi:hypothetical protein